MKVRQKFMIMAVVPLIAGCTTSALLEEPFPEPVVDRLPLTIGVFYSDDFRDFVYNEDILAEAGVDVEKEIPPKSVAEFLNILDRVRKAGKVPFWHPWAGDTGWIPARSRFRVSRWIRASRRRLHHSRSPTPGVKWPRSTKPSLSSA